MTRPFVTAALALFTCLLANADDVVFKSDVALTRVDAQVRDRDGHNVTGLQVNDFVLKVNGKATPIRNFASENMPLDILLLLDVSGSMQPHVQRIADAAQQALNVLTPKDRVAIMVFDTSARVRLPFRSDHDQVTHELNHLLRSESFSRGTRITDAMISAANYVAREARPEARRAVVILTDDQTQDEEDEPRVENALARANAILSFLQAPYEPPTMAGRGGGGHRRGGTWGGGGGGWPGGGGGIGFPGGGIGFPGGRSGRGGGYGGVDPSHSAGTATVASDSGGDTLQVDEASALEDTLSRLRQRYTLNFYLPEDVKTGDQPSVKVDLSQQAKIRYADADIHYRRVYMSGGSHEQSGPTAVTHTRQPVYSDPDADPVETTPSARRKVAVNEDSSSPVSTIDSDSSDADKQAAPATSQPSSKTTPGTGWPKATPPATPPN